jgi:hypothetical protein
MPRKAAKRNEIVPCPYSRKGGNAVTVRKNPSPSPNLIHTRYVCSNGEFPVLGGFKGTLRRWSAQIGL